VKDCIQQAVIVDFSAYLKFTRKTYEHCSYLTSAKLYNKSFSRKFDACHEFLLLIYEVALKSDCTMFPYVKIACWGIFVNYEVQGTPKRSLNGFIHVFMTNLPVKSVLFK